MSQGVRLALIGLVPLLALLIGLYLFREILLPFLVGMAAAYLLDPAADRLQRFGLRRTAATIVISGATSGDAPSKAELTKIFFKQLRVVGSTMGTRDELVDLARFVVQQRIEPVIDTVLPLTEAREGFTRMADGEVFGKVVFTVP